MKSAITIAIVGAGSSYTPELVQGLIGLDEAEVPVRELRLHDVDDRRLDIMAGLARRMTAHQGRRLVVSAGTDLEQQVRGADFVITQIRVGGMDARHLDESIPLKYGIIGQETTGPGGLFKALRTIPPMLEIARTVERAAPEAFILNYTNPSGIIAEAVCNHSRARFIGLCSGIPGIQDRIREILSGRWPAVKSYCVGLNHLGFIHRYVSDGADVTPEALALLYENSIRHGGIANPELLTLLQAVPISYVNYYFRRGQSVADARAKGHTRAEDIRGIEAEILAEAADPACVSKPAALCRRGGGGYADITFRFLRAILHDRGDELACSVLNRGAVEGIPDEAAVEVVCRVDARGAAPIPVGPIPLSFRGLVQAVKAYETLAVQAAVERSRSLALRALVAHPLCGDLDVARPLLDEMLAAHQLDYR
jgi:6-phospho-beta-glucosidase